MAFDVLNVYIHSRNVFDYKSTKIHPILRTYKQQVLNNCQISLEVPNNVGGSQLDVAKGRQLGSSAHTDFGAIALLLQDDHAGIKVQDRKTGDCVRVPPNKDAYVVNLGDMMSRITRGHYKSSIHRAINKNLVDCYSVVFFFDGNVDYKLRPLSRVGQDSDEED